MHVDLQQEVNAAAKVKAEIHRQCIDLQEPLGRIGHQVGSDDVGRIRTVGVKSAFEHFTSLQLLFGFRRIKAHAHGVLLSTLLIENAVGLQLCIRKRFFHTSEHRLVDLHRRLAGTHLHCGRFAVKIRQGVQRRNEQNHSDDDVLPKSVSIHNKNSGSVRCPIPHKTANTDSDAFRCENGIGEKRNSPSAYKTLPLRVSCPQKTAVLIKQFHFLRKNRKRP